MKKQDGNAKLVLSSVTMQIDLSVMLEKKLCYPLNSATNGLSLYIYYTGIGISTSHFLSELWVSEWHCDANG